jgi:UrcA family protein
MKSAIRCLLLATCLGASAVALAADPADQPPRRIVRFADLDLHRNSDAVVLYQRILFAAREVCAPLVARNLEQMMLARRCTEQAIARAVEDVNAPMLTSYYMQKEQPPVLIARR